MVSFFQLSFVAFLCLVAWTNPTLSPFAKEKYRKDEFDVPYGKWAVICGASDGIGLEWAFALAERGLHVVLIGRNLTALQAAKTAIELAVPPMKARVIQLDLGLVEEWKKIAAQLAEELEIGFVVYNAAYSAVGPFASYPLAMQEQTVRLNVYSPMVAVSAFLGPMMKRKRGAIVLMSSADGEGCSPFVSNYAGTKAWATTFAEALWYELQPHNIDVLSVIAGLTGTKSLDGVLDDEKRKTLWLLESTPRNVVLESLLALGKGHPTVITGLGTKLVTFMRWILPRAIECHVMSALKDIVKNEKDLFQFAQATFQDQQQGSTVTGSDEL